MAFAFCGAEGMRVLKSTQGLLATLRASAMFLYACTDTLSEWLRRWTRNPLGSARKGSNPLGVALLARYVAGVWMYPGTDTLSEWLRRWTRNLLGSARKGSNPLGVALLARYVAGVWKPLP